MLAYVCSAKVPRFRSRALLVQGSVFMSRRHLVGMKSET